MCYHGAMQETRGRLARLAARLDTLNEFEREPVAPDHLKGGRHFAAIYGGEHIAGTEFVIGSFFVLHGVGARDLILGLIAGNILAVLSWTLICAPIAVRTRLTLYWYLRRIAGPGVGVLYSVANALLFCFLAGAMIALSADAVSTALEALLKNLGIAFARPSLADRVPSDPVWVVLVLLCGGLFTAIAILGFEKMARFASACVPWMFALFIAGALASLPAIGLGTTADLGDLADRIWTGIPRAGQEKFTFWHIASFAWFCNLCTHVDLSDMALFRFARHWGYGLYSGIGMFLGHFLAWICSGVMCAALFQGSVVANPNLWIGRMASEAAGLAGLLCVLLASWTTANPTLYRAGLALQIATPGWPRWKVTLAAGIITSVAACFPVFVMSLLDFVAIFGLVLMPVGAIVFAEHWILPRLGMEPCWAERRRLFANPAAVITWAASLAFCFLVLGRGLGVPLFFLWLPGYILALVLYPALAAAMGARASAGAPVPTTEAIGRACPPPAPASGSAPPLPRWRACARAVAVAALIAIVGAAAARAASRIEVGPFHAIVNIATLVWFIAGPLWLAPGLFGLRERKDAGSAAPPLAEDVRS
jgi:cytosine permease